MQYRHPMQVLSLTSTTPSSVEKVAPTGQTCTHGGWAHWLQSFGTKKLRKMGRDGISSSGASPVWMLVTTASPVLGIMYLSTQVR